MQPVRSQDGSPNALTPQPAGGMPERGTRSPGPPSWTAAITWETDQQKPQGQGWASQSCVTLSKFRTLSVPSLPRLREN